MSHHFCLVARGLLTFTQFSQGFVGFLINIAGFLQIKVTSPVTHMVSSAVRGVLQTFVAMAIFDEIVSSQRWLGIFLTICGSIFYTWVRHQESMEEEVAYEAAPVKLDEETPQMESVEKTDV
jgi:GDP-fucose transporter C1